MGYRSIAALDMSLAAWFHAHASPGATVAALAVTFLGSEAFLTAAVLFTAFLLLVKRAWYRVLLLTLTMVGGGVLSPLLKELFRRPRPSFADPLIGVSGFSLPSGHVMGATLFYGLIAYFIARSGPRRRGIGAVLGASVLVALIALTRIYLGAHYLSDTVAAFAAALAWLALCASVVEAIERRRRP